MGSLFGGSSAVQVAPTPPAPPTLRDEIGGVEQVAVENDDGTVTYVTRRLPLTAEEQAEKDELDRIMADALGQIEALSDADYEHDDMTKARLDAWAAERQKLVDSNFSERRYGEENTLARRGLGDSSAGEAVRRQRLLDKKDADEQLQNEKTLLADDIRNQNLALQQNLYNLAASKQSVSDVKAMQSAARGQSSYSSYYNLNRASVADYYGNNYSNNNSDDSMANLFTNAANLVAGVYLPGVGSSSNALFGLV